MNRMEIAELRVVCEWDEESGEMTFGCGLASRWKVLEDLRELVGGMTGPWEEIALMERASTVEGQGIGGCFTSLRDCPVVLVWRARFVMPRDSRRVAELIEHVYHARGRGEL